jgi:ferrochelatase
VFRAPKSKEGYAAIGGGSPLRKITDEQVECISGLNANVFFFFLQMLFFFNDSC